MLIAMQRPDATRVAGFRAWLKLNRCVRKGEKGIRIFAPMTVPDRGEDGATVVDENGQPKRKTLFRLTTVFDVSQTDRLPGTEPVALSPPAQPIAGDSHTDLIAPLQELGRELGYRVEIRDLPEHGPGGWCDDKQKQIVIGAAPANRQVRTLVHELAHALGVGYDQYGREQAEVLVDCVTYIVCSSVGLDVGGESIPYIAGWGEDGALDAIREYAQTIDEIARRIENVLSDSSDARNARLEQAA
jgi:hypothetical protein